MANMFSGYSKKSIPKNLDECTQGSPVADILWGWAERIEKWGIILLWLIIIGGLILSITDSFVVEELSRSSSSYYGKTYTETSFMWATFFSEILNYALYAFIEYCTYHVLALLISSLASIVQNTNVSANVALFCASNEYETTSEETVSEEKEGETWICPKCGSKNNVGKIQCSACGYYK